MLYKSIVKSYDLLLHTKTKELDVWIHKGDLK